MVACPRCGNQDAVQKVSSIVSGGTYETNYEMPAQGQLGGHKFYGTVQQRGVAQTALAQKLNIDRSDKSWKAFANERATAAVKAFRDGNPAPKKGCLPQILPWLYLPGCLLTMFIIALVGQSLYGTDFDMMAAFVIAVFIWLLPGWGLSKLSRKILPPERKKWEADLANTKEEALAEAAHIKSRTFTRWERLYYCHRDDLVFLPEEHLSAPSSNMMHLLMWE
ncbi:MAG: hypothetical protein FJ011_24110 [Chloroflexi bacterium]|nr:hypothetical protein [Chloroflexota bacterium]